MSAQANLVVPDAAATPVNHTFKPLGAAGGVAKWIDQTQNIVQGMPRIAVNFREPLGKDVATRAFKHEVLFTMPVLEVAASGSVTGYNPPSKEAYRLVGRASYSIPERAALQERKDFVKMFAYFLQYNTGWPIYDQVIDLNPPF